MCNRIKLVLGFLLFWYTGWSQFALDADESFPDLSRSTTNWADFNNDGTLDLLLTGIDADGNKHTKLYWNFSAGFELSTISLPAISDAEIGVQDLNQDEWLDIAMSGVNSNGERISNVYINNSATSFSALSLTIIPVANALLLLEDLNQDGRIDVLLSGTDVNNNKVIQVLKNLGENNFELVQTDLPAMAYGDVLSLDVNNDQWVDLVFSGLDINNQRKTVVYKNNSTFRFELTNIALPGVRSGKLSKSDVDLDGDDDLLVTGNTGGTNSLTTLYRNHNNSSFTEFQNFVGLVDGGGSWGDYDNDGFPDLVLFGYSSTHIVKIFQNENGNSLLEIPSAISGISKGEVSWVDYTGDKKLDLSISGSGAIPFTALYENGTLKSNTNPTVPSNLQYETYEDSVVLFWSPSSDAETVSSGLRYDLVLGTTAGNSDLHFPLSNINSGTRKINSTGVYTNRMVLHGLPQGQYFWKVQAIDPAFGASAFSQEAFFASCHKSFITGADTTCFGSTRTLHLNENSVEVRWYSGSTLLGTGASLDRVVVSEEKIVAVIEKNIGCSVKDSVQLQYWELPEVTIPEEKFICTGNKLNVESSTAADNLSWFWKNDPVTIVSTENIFEQIVTTSDSLILLVKDIHQCSNSDTSNINVWNLPVVSLGNDTLLCLSKEIEYHQGTSGDSVNWYSDLHGQLNTNHFQQMLTVTTPVVLWVQLFDQNRCVNYDTVNIGLHEIPVADAGPERRICPASSIQIGLSFPENALVSWSPASLLDNATALFPLASPTVDTEFLVDVTDVHGCKTKDSVVIRINPPGQVDVGFAQEMCINDEVRLGGIPTATGSVFPYAYQWSPAQTLSNAEIANPIARPKENTEYTLLVKAGECFVGEYTVNVTVHPLPIVSLGPDQLIGSGEQVQLQAKGATTYQWFPEEFFSGSETSFQAITPNNTNQYWVIGTDEHGCKNSDTIVVTVKAVLFIPSLFTPNGDGNNEVFGAHGFGIQTIKLSVYDKFGRKIFETETLDQAWDGTCNGEEVESGCYIWKVEGRFNDGSTLHMDESTQGFIKLLR